MKTKMPFAKPLFVAAMIAASTAVAGCGTDSNADLVNGKTLFVQKCKACHVLARAEATSGQVGPNLDDAFAGARAAGMPDSTIASVVEQQILYPGKGNALDPKLVMPANLVTASQARDIGAYVGLVAGRSGEDTGALAEAGAADVSGKKVTADSSNKLQIDADPSGTTAFLAGLGAAKAGKLTLASKNTSSVPHNIALKGPGVDEQGTVGSGGSVSQITATVKPGKYTFYCSVPGHEAGGMKGTLVVK